MYICIYIITWPTAHILLIHRQMAQRKLNWFKWGLKRWEKFGSEFTKLQNLIFWPFLSLVQLESVRLSRGGDPPGAWQRWPRSVGGPGRGRRSLTATHFVKSPKPSEHFDFLFCSWSFMILALATNERPRQNSGLEQKDLFFSRKSKSQIRVFSEDLFWQQQSTCHSCCRGLVRDMMSWLFHLWILVGETSLWHPLQSWLGGSVQWFLPAPISARMIVGF